MANSFLSLLDLEDLIRIPSLLVQALDGKYGQGKLSLVCGKLRLDIHVGTDT